MKDLASVSGVVVAISLGRLDEVKLLLDLRGDHRVKIPLRSSLERPDAGLSTHITLVRHRRSEEFQFCFAPWLRERCRACQRPSATASPRVL